MRKFLKKLAAHILPLLILEALFMTPVIIMIWPLIQAHPGEFKQALYAVFTGHWH